MRILIIRHAKTEENAKGLAIGKKDSPLSAGGKREARSLARLLKKEGIVEIFSSPALRARETAWEISKETGAKVRVESALREFDFGELEGKSYEEFPKKHIGKLFVHPADADYSGHGGESYSELYSRLGSLAKKLEKRKKEDVTVALVTHLVTGRTLISRILGISPELSRAFWIDNSSVSEIAFLRKSHPVLRKLNIIGGTL